MTRESKLIAAAIEYRQSAVVLLPDAASVSDTMARGGLEDTMTKTLTIRFETDLDVTSELQRAAKDLVVAALRDVQDRWSGTFSDEEKALLDAMLDDRTGGAQ